MARILLDMDGVVANFSDGIREWIGRFGGHELGLPDEVCQTVRETPATCWSFYRIDWPLDFKTFDKAVRIATDRGFWLALDSMDDSLERVNEIHDAGHEIHVVSNPWGKKDEGRGSCYYKCISQKAGWVALRELPVNSIRFGHAHKLDPDLHLCIEDHIINLVEWSATGRQAICVNRPWNNLTNHQEAWLESIGNRDERDILSRITFADWDAIPGLVEELQS